VDNNKEIDEKTLELANNEEMIG
jgi:hypothetical protein